MLAIDSGARLERATVRGPAVIGAGSVVCDAYGAVHRDWGASVHRALRDRAFDVLADSTVDGLDGQIEASLLGRDCQRRTQSGGFRAPSGSCFGDNAETAIL